MSVQSSSTSTPTPQTLDGLEKEITDFAKNGEVQKGWLGRKIFYNKAEVSEKALWKKLEEQIVKSDADETTWTTVALCEKKLSLIHDKIENDSAGILQRLLDWIFGVRASPEKEHSTVLNAINAINKNICPQSTDLRDMAVRTLHFTLWDENNKFPELKDLIIKGLPQDESAKEKTLELFAQTITSYNLQDIIPLSLHTKDIAFPIISDSQADNKNQKLSNLFVTKIKENLSSTFLTKLTDSFEEIYKAPLKALFEYAAQQSPERSRLDHPIPPWGFLPKGTILPKGTFLPAGTYLSKINRPDPDKLCLQPINVASPGMELVDGATFLGPKPTPISILDPQGNIIRKTYSQGETLFEKGATAPEGTIFPQGTYLSTENLPKPDRIIWDSQDLETDMELQEDVAFPKGLILTQGAIRPPFPETSEKKAPEEKLIRDFLKSGSNSTKIFELLTFLNTNTRFFSSITPKELKNPIDIQKFISQIKKVLIPLLSLPQPKAEDFSTLFTNDQKKFELLKQLLNTPEDFNNTMATSPNKNKLWEDVISIVTTLEQQKNLNAEIAAITILQTAMPPQQPSDMLQQQRDETYRKIINAVLPLGPSTFIKETKFTEKLLINRQEYKQFSDSLLEKALTVSLLEDPDISIKDSEKNKKTGAATPFLHKIEKTPEDAIYLLCCLRNDKQRASQLYLRQQKIENYVFTT